jgi:hypothetical protein
VARYAEGKMSTQKVEYERLSWDTFFQQAFEGFDMQIFDGYGKTIRGQVVAVNRFPRIARIELAWPARYKTSFRGQTVWAPYFHEMYGIPMLRGVIPVLHRATERIHISLPLPVRSRYAYPARAHALFFLNDSDRIPAHQLYDPFGQYYSWPEFPTYDLSELVHKQFV